ncbi:hypothetical protein [Effusibacillus lacus]|uniref:hypothetical protein n=1 Tax=Effusibacillus lacus TaxID=1348429 RepID=UPI000BB81C13|nr:hypothetical protein [Effusibacillus lacus]TCS67862.1 hypothetical protein EDD64_14911 [Effusibacillus lacus]
MAKEMIGFIKTKLLLATLTEVVSKNLEFDRGRILQLLQTPSQARREATKQSKNLRNTIS